MQFENPKILWLLLSLPLFLYILIKSFNAKKKALNNFIGKSLIEKLSSGLSFRRKKIKIFILFIIYILLITALYGPQIGSKVIEIKQRGLDIFIALDCSLSMDAEDAGSLSGNDKLSRIAKAKLELENLIEKLNGNRIGIIAFAGAAFVQCPLTLDSSACRLFLSQINTALIPHQGTSVGEAIRLAVKVFPQNKEENKVLILLTDGEDHKTQPVEAAKQAKENGIKIYAIGIGSAKGEPIPVKDSSGKLSTYKKNNSGSVVMSRLNEKELAEIANITGGRYYKATAKEEEIEQIYKNIAGYEKKDLEGKFYQRLQNRYLYFSLFALLLLIIEYFIPEKYPRAGSK